MTDHLPPVIPGQTSIIDLLDEQAAPPMPDPPPARAYVRVCDLPPVPEPTQPRGKKKGGPREYDPRTAPLPPGY